MNPCECGCGREASVGKRFRQGHHTKRHGHSLVGAGRRSPTYASWVSMKSRCHAQHDSQYPRYGGRGIVVCDRWRWSFENFLADMGERPNVNLSLDRIDNDGNYELGNCRWATAQEQQDNRTHGKRLPRWVEFMGRRLTISGWSRAVGISAHTLSSRLDRGWAIERALTTRPMRHMEKGKSDG